MDINQITLDNKFKLVEASAGTGKSFTLAHLVLRHVLEKKIISEIDNFVNEIYKLQVTTFHSFCNNIIDEYSIEIGLTPVSYTHLTLPTNA